MKMSERQWRTMSLIERIGRGEITVSEAAASLGRSERQMQRILKRVSTGGAEALVHGNTGRAPGNKVSDEVRQHVVELRREKYEGFNDHHFTDKLHTVEGITLPRETVRRILRDAGVGSPRVRRPPKHRSRRERRPQAGQMIQWDGSTHDWLEGRGDVLCLMAAVDDATSEILPGAHFTERECTVGYLRVLRDVLRERGIPQTVYGDRHGSLSRNDKRWSLEEELAGRREPTHVKRALDDLGVEVIYARSPQAKGRIERAWGTLQDRLVAELRLAGASTRGEANKVLRAYLPQHNRLFALPAAEAQPAWRRAPTDHVLLLELCALQYVKKVSKSNTVRVGGRVLDIPRSNGNYAGQAVTVKHLLSGQYRIHFGGKCIAWCEGERPTSPVPGSRTELGFSKRERLQREHQQVSDDEEDADE
ncbi:MAG: ISNCY family transposase [Deltaproteobacteria bacterium]|nr:ISNCY family transposase [Kofleriaceae bacterium]